MPSTWRASHSQLGNLGGGRFLGGVHFGLSSYRKKPLLKMFFVLGSFTTKSNDNFYTYDWIYDDVTRIFLMVMLAPSIHNPAN